MPIPVFTCRTFGRRSAPFSCWRKSRGEREGDPRAAASWFRLATRRTMGWCSGLVQRYALPIGVLGPAPCPLVRIKDRWRWHVLLRGPSPVLGRIVRYGARRLRREGNTRIVIDRDPVSLL